jgi:hypothetical protein
MVKIHSRSSDKKESSSLSKRITPLNQPIKKNNMKTEFNKTFDASFTVEKRTEKTILTISGRLITPEADSIWEPINAWLENYIKFPSNETEINFELDYINTRNVVELFKTLKHIEKSELHHSFININWLCETGDYDMVNLGYDLNVLCGLPFKIKYVEAVRISA